VIYSISNNDNNSGNKKCHVIRYVDNDIKYYIILYEKIYSTRFSGRKGLYKFARGQKRGARS